MKWFEYKIASVAPFVAFTITNAPNVFIIEFTVAIYVSLNIVLLLRNFATFFSNSASAWLVCLSLISVDINFWLLERKNAYAPPSSPCCLLKTEDSKRE